MELKTDRNDLKMYWYPSESYTNLDTPSATGNNWRKVEFTYTQSGINRSSGASALVGFVNL